MSPIDIQIGLDYQLCGSGVPPDLRQELTFQNDKSKRSPKSDLDWLEEIGLERRANDEKHGELCLWLTIIGCLAKYHCH